MCRNLLVWKWINFTWHVTFEGVIQTLDKLHRVCTLLITPQQLMFVIRSEVIVWAGLSVVLLPYMLHPPIAMQKSLCESYDVQSLNDNEIGLELDLSQMFRALKAAQTSDVEMKLKKIQQQPYLSFTMTSRVCIYWTLWLVLQHFQGAQHVTVTQDVPVMVLTGTQVRELVEPKVPVPEVCSYLLVFSVSSDRFKYSCHLWSSCGR